MSILGTDCLMCEYLDDSGEDVYCTCSDEEIENDAGDFSIKEIINLLIELLIAGQVTINREQILKLTEKCK